MKSIIKLSIAALVIAFASGCASTGGQGSPVANAGAAVGNAASAVGNGIGNVFSALDYKTGVHVTEAQMATFVKGRTTKNDVINAIGHPPTKSNVSGMEVWTYTYTHIPALPFAKGAFENTVFEFRGNTLHAVYKSAGTPGKSGNPMLDAAGM